MSKFFQIKRFNPQNIGLAKVLGKLEADIMELIWQQEISTVREVCDQLSKIRKRGFSFNTIMTIMNRLVQKGLLEKRQGDNCYEYKSKLNKKEFLDNISDNVIKDLMRDFKPYVLAHFAENLDQDDLEELIKLRKRYSEEK